MNQSRRDAMRIASVLGLAVAAGIIKPGMAIAADWNANAFNAKTLPEAEKAEVLTAFAAHKDEVTDGYRTAN